MEITCPTCGNTSRFRVHYDRTYSYMISKGDTGVWAGSNPCSDYFGNKTVFCDDCDDDQVPITDEVDLQLADLDCT